jgi:hypothetical protein
MAYATITKERPIIFSGPMVRAILKGNKTQTRRVVKKQRDMEFDAADPYYGPYWLSYATEAEGEDAKVRCPYGKPGDRLWVREAFIHEPAEYCLEASVSIPCRPATTWYRADITGDTRGVGWKPSIYMPRWASRITLEITGIRVERLQQISREDAQAEGIERVGGNYSCSPWRNYMLQPMAPTVLNSSDPRHSFMTLWKSINSAGSWDANPWVWVVEFRQVNPTSESD